MTSNNVFNCQVCSLRYDHLFRIPMSLDCGDVICLPCITKLTSQTNDIICPLDGKTLYINIKTLQTCKTILDHLPIENKGTSSFFRCKVHHEKKVKYFCDTEGKAFCSLCWKDHGKHKINSFYPNKHNFSKEICTILQSVNDKSIKVSDENKAFDQYKTKWITTYNNNITWINKETERVISEINNEKSRFWLEMKKEFQAIWVKYDTLLKDNSNYTKRIDSFKNNFSKIKLNLDKEENYAIYDDFQSYKQDWVQKWEALIMECNKNSINIGNFDIFTLTLKKCQVENYVKFGYESNKNDNKENVANNGLFISQCKKGNYPAKEVTKDIIYNGQISSGGKNGNKDSNMNSMKTRFTTRWGQSTLKDSTKHMIDNVINIQESLNHKPTHRKNCFSLNTCTNEREETLLFD